MIAEFIGGPKDGQTETLSGRVVEEFLSITMQPDDDATSISLYRLTACTDEKCVYMWVRHTMGVHCRGGRWLYVNLEPEA